MNNYDYEAIEQTKNNFPALEKIWEVARIGITEKNELVFTDLNEENTVVLDQQDCLELSQLFSVLATAFREVEVEEDEA